MQSSDLTMDYEADLVKQFKKLEQFWHNKGRQQDQFVSKCIFYLEAYGVGPSLNVGFEEALFLANKIKANLGGALSTEKMLYLLFITLKKRGKSRTSSNSKNFLDLDQSQEEDYGDSETTFRAFIIRFLYYQREQRIVNQVQKMGQMEEVRAAFRSKSDENHLQFHQIEALSNSSNIIKPQNVDSHQESSHSDDTDQESQLWVMKKQNSFSSKFHPELCRRNSHGQFVRRGKRGSIRPPPVKFDNLTNDEFKIVNTEQASQIVCNMKQNFDFQDVNGSIVDRRQSKLNQKEAMKKAKYDTKGGLLGKRTRNQIQGLSELQDAPNQVFVQTASLADVTSTNEDQLMDVESKISKKQKIGVSSSNKQIISKQNRTNQKCDTTLSTQLGANIIAQQKNAQKLEKKSLKQIGPTGQTKNAKQSDNQQKIWHKKPTGGLMGGQPRSSDKNSQKEVSGQQQQQSKHQNGNRTAKQGRTGPVGDANREESNQNAESVQDDVASHQDSHTLTEKSIDASVLVSSVDQLQSQRPRRSGPAIPFRMVADKDLPQNVFPKNLHVVKSSSMAHKPIQGKKETINDRPTHTDKVSFVQVGSRNEFKAYSAPANDAIENDEASRQHNPEELLNGLNSHIEGGFEEAESQSDMDDLMGEEGEEELAYGDEDMEDVEYGDDDDGGTLLNADGDIDASEFREADLAEALEASSGAGNTHMDVVSSMQDGTRQPAEGAQASVTESEDNKEGDEDGTTQQAESRPKQPDNGKIKGEEQDIQIQDNGVDISSDETGRVTRVVTVYKLEPKNAKKSAAKQQKSSEFESSDKKASNDKSLAENKIKPAGIYQMLMRITNGIKEKKKKVTAKVIKKSTKLQEKKEKEAKINKNKKFIDPQQELYMEQDIKTALTQQQGVQQVVKRRQRQNYLAYAEPFDLNILLDDAYWLHKAQQLDHPHEEVVRLSALNKVYELGRFEDGSLHEFLDFKESVESESFKVKHLFWQNQIDSAVPYQSGFQDKFWNYIQSNEIVNNNVRQYLAKAKRQSFCNCLDGCQNSRKCPCYKWNRKLQNPTYNKILSPRSGQMIAFQQRAKTSINKVFSFNECHPRCSCNKDMCQNFLIAAQNKKKFQFLIRRLSKTLSPIYQGVQDLSKTGLGAQLKTKSDEPSSQTSNKLSSAGIFSTMPKQVSMWGLIAMEEIPAGAFLMEYLGEIVSKKQGDMRGTYYDDNGLSYLFDLNDPSESDEREQIIQKVYYNEFFPLCLDSMFYGNEARFINHSCDPNVLSFNLTGQVDSNVYHSIGLFATRKILVGEELTLDYQWDKNDLTISQDVPCLCGSLKCRGFLMRAKKMKKSQSNNVKLESRVTSKQNETSSSIIPTKSLDTNGVQGPASVASNQSLQAPNPPLLKVVSNPANIGENGFGQASESPLAVQSSMPLSAGVQKETPKNMLESEISLTSERPLTDNGNINSLAIGKSASQQIRKDFKPASFAPKQVITAVQEQKSSIQMIYTGEQGSRTPMQQARLIQPLENLKPSVQPTLVEHQKPSQIVRTTPQKIVRPPPQPTGMFNPVNAMTLPQTQKPNIATRPPQPVKNITLPPAVFLVKQATQVAAGSTVNVTAGETRRFKQVKNSGAGVGYVSNNGSVIRDTNGKANHNQQHHKW